MGLRRLPFLLEGARQVIERLDELLDSPLDQARCHQIEIDADLGQQGQRFAGAFQIFVEGRFHLAVIEERFKRLFGSGRKKS